MGLFDSYYYDAPTYADPSQQGGLLGRLISAVQAGGYDPSSTAVPAPVAPAAAPVVASDDDEEDTPAQASPIGVGSYQMPRIGSAADFTPNPAAIPQNAQPTQGQLPAPVPVPAAPSGDILSHIGAALQSIGAPNSLFHNVVTNPINALITGQTPEQQAVQQRYNAYLAAGVPQRQAQLAAIDPVLAHALIPQMLAQGSHTQETDKDGNIWDVNRQTGQRTIALAAQKDKFTNVPHGKDAMGAETYDTLNQATGERIPVPNAPGATDGAMGDPTLTGKDYLASLPTKQRGTVQGMVEGTLPPPYAFALAKPYWQNMIAAAKQVDPTWDAANWPGRVKGVVSFKSGADAGTVRSANQVLGHISDLTDMADALHNTDYPAWNAVKNTWNSQAGAEARNNWITQAHAVGDEMSAFMKGAGHSSDAEIRQWQESLSPNMSPQQQRGAINTLMGIYDHALQALDDKRTGAVGPVAAEKMGPLVTLAGQSAMDKVRKWGAGAAGVSPAAPTPGKTKTGVSWSVVQ